MLEPYRTGRPPWRSELPPEPTDELGVARRKLFYFGLLVFAVFGVLTIQLARMQLVNGEAYRLRAETNRLRQVPVLPPRGLIYDRNGLPLVENRPGYAAAVVAADVPDGGRDFVVDAEEETAITIALQELTGVPAGDIAATIEARRRSNDPFTPVTIKEDMSQETAFALRERLADLPGVRVVVEPRRYYPQGGLMAHILGFVRGIDAEEYERLAGAGYRMTDQIGKAGVELTYESVLRGKPGRRDVETDASGREIRVLGEVPAKPGTSLVLAIDTELQRRVEEYLRAAMGRSRNAAAVVMDVRTGEVLALVSLPTYDNNLFTGEVDAAALERLLADPAKPLVNHAIAEMYPPGSTFKQVTGLAALQEGIANANTQITSLGSIQVEDEFVPGRYYTFRDWSALGTLNFYRGVAMSSDVYFYYLAGGYSEKGKDLFQGLGATRLADWARRFGLGAATGIDLPGESEGIVPDPAWKEKTLGTVWTIGDTYNFGIGQGYVTATPMQILLVTAAIANGGNVLIPHVVKALRDGDGNVLPLERQYVRRNLHVDRRNLDVLREGMRQAVADGTARTASVRNVEVAGKTGTAEFGERRPDGTYLEHGWFTGFAPFQDPQIAIVVFLEQGNGAANAAPVAAKVFDYYFNGRKLASGGPP